MHISFQSLFKSDKGFTVVELIVAVVIIAIMVAIAIPIYAGIQLSAAESAHSANVRTLKGAAVIWHTENSMSAIEPLVILMSDGVYAILHGDLKSFGDYIDGPPPKVPHLVRSEFAGNPGNYLVRVLYDGTVTVTPGYISQGS